MRASIRCSRSWDNESSRGGADGESWARRAGGRSELGGGGGVLDKVGEEVFDSIQTRANVGVVSEGSNMRTTMSGCRTLGSPAEVADRRNDGGGVDGRSRGSRRGREGRKEEKDELVWVFSTVDEGSTEMWDLPSDAVRAGILPVALLFPVRERKGWGNDQKRRRTSSLNRRDPIRFG